MSGLGADEFSQDFIVVDALMTARARVDYPALAPETDIDPPPCVTSEHAHFIAPSNGNSIVPVLVTENGIQGDSAILTLAAVAPITAATVTRFDGMRTLAAVSILGVGLVATIAWTVLLGYGLVLMIAYML